MRRPPHNNLISFVIIIIGERTIELQFILLLFLFSPIALSTSSRCETEWRTKHASPANGLIIWLEYQRPYIVIIDCWVVNSFQLAMDDGGQCPLSVRSEYTHKFRMPFNRNCVLIIDDNNKFVEIYGMILNSIPYNSSSDAAHRIIIWK